MQIRNGLVARCFFKNNSITGTFGGAIIMINAVVEDCIFIGNSAGLGGGAIDAYGGTVRRCLFTQSDGGPGSAITVNGGLLVEHCTFVENCGSPVIGVESGSLSITNSIIAFNAGIDSPIGQVDFPPWRQNGGKGDWITTISCMDIFGNDGGDWVGDIAQYFDQDGNISANPLFCDYKSLGYCVDSGGTFTLFANSPCAPAHSGSCGLIGAYGVGCEPSSVEAKSWGRIKVLYR